MEPFTIDNTRYERTPQRRCGLFGLKLPAISLGAWETFGGYRGPEIAKECIHAAFDLGIFHFDLANNYGRPPGQAEAVVGPVLRQLPREELIVSTKAGFLMWPGPFGQGCSRKSLLSSVDQSLQRLGLDHVDIFYAHRFDAETPLEETLGALNDIVRHGKAVYAGLSNYSGAQFNEAIELARQRNYGPIVVEQSSYNILNRQIENELLPAVARAGLGMVAFSPLSQGLLSEKYLGGIPEDSRAAQMWTPEQRATISEQMRIKIGRLNELARARGQTLPQMAIAWILRRPEITSALIGASSPEQIRENAGSLGNLGFGDAELAQIDQIACGP
jgi:L-glyceraldehyde 3-phosphate reductase